MVSFHDRGTYYAETEKMVRETRLKEVSDGARLYTQRFIPM